MKNLLLTDTSPSASRRGIGQRIAYGMALVSYLCAILCLAALFIWIGELGSEHPVIASLGASLVFFVGAGVVLHVIGRANLPDLRFSQGRNPP